MRETIKLRSFLRQWVGRATRPSRRATGPAAHRGPQSSNATWANRELWPHVPVGGSPTGTGGSPVLPLLGGGSIAICLLFSGFTAWAAGDRPVDYANPLVGTAPLD